MTGLDRLAAELAHSADELARVAGELQRLAPAPFAEFAAAPGRLGDVGRCLSRQFDAAWQVRHQESLDASAAMRSLSEAVERAIVNYGETDDDTRRAVGRLHGEEP